MLRYLTFAATVAALTLAPLPTTAAKPAPAAARPAAEPSPVEKVTSSRLTGVSLPDGALRIIDAGMSGELTGALKGIAQEKGATLGGTEALLWGGPGHNAARNDGIKASLVKKLEAAGFRYKSTGEMDIKQGKATLFTAEKGAKQSVLGVIVAADEYLAVAWGEVGRKEVLPENTRPEEAKTQEEPGTEAAPAKKDKPGATPAELLGRTWSWTTISSVNYQNKTTGQLSSPSGMSAKFTFLPNGRYKYFFYIRQQTYSLVTQATSTHEGTVTFNGDGTFNLHAEKGHYTGNTGTKVIDRAMTDEERSKPQVFSYEWRRENGKRELYIGPSKSSLSRFRPDK